MGNPSGVDSADPASGQDDGTPTGRFDAKALELLRTLGGDVADRYWRGEIGLDGLPVGDDDGPGVAEPAPGDGADAGSGVVPVS